MARPSRKSIWDNFTSEQAVFIDALMETMPGARLSVSKRHKQIKNRTFFVDYDILEFEPYVELLRPDPELEGAFSEWRPPVGWSNLSSMSAFLKRAYRDSLVNALPDTSIFRRFQ